MAEFVCWVNMPLPIDSESAMPKLLFGWVVSTERSSEPFVIGPFDDEPAGNLWRKNLSPYLVEELYFYGKTVIFPACDYTCMTYALWGTDQSGI